MQPSSRTTGDFRAKPQPPIPPARKSDSSPQAALASIILSTAHSPQKPSPKAPVVQANASNTRKPVPPPRPPRKLVAVSAHPSDSNKKSEHIQDGDRFLSQNNHTSALESYTKGLIEAEETQNIFQIATILQRVGMIEMEKRNFSRAAKMINGALAYFQKVKAEQPYQEEVISLLAKIERLFLEKECPGAKVEKVNAKSFLDRRKQLSDLRENCVEKSLERGETAQNILSNFSSGIKGFIENLLQDCMAILGPPPCKYALICLGSLSRMEMSPYSDLEFALLIEKETTKNRDYFRLLIRLLELKVINLGETRIPILNRGFDSPTPRGFSYDDGGNTPLGKPGQVELIGIPDSLAIHQSIKNFEEDLILSNTLRTVGLIAGDPKLVATYEKRVQQIVAEKSAPEAKCIRESRALNIIKGHLVEYAPNLNKSKEQNPFYNIKTELYRLPNMLISALADFYGIEKKNTWERIDALQRLGVFSVEAVKNLKAAMEDIMRLRIRSHLHYREERDDVYHSSIKKSQACANSDIFQLQEGDLDVLERLYGAILPMHRLFQQLGATGNPQVLVHENFCDKSQLAQGLMHQHFDNIAAAKSCYQKAIALRPDDVQTLLWLALNLSQLADYEEAKKYAEKALAQFNAKTNQDLKIKIALLSILSDIHSCLENQTKANDLQKERLELIRRCYGEKSLEYAEALEMLGLYDTLADDFEQGIACYAQSLQLYEKLLGSTHRKVAKCLTGMGQVHKFACRQDEAIDCLERSLAIHRECDKGGSNTDTAYTLAELASVLVDEGQVKRAIGLYEEAVQIDVVLFGKESRRLASNLISLGEAHASILEFQVALKYFEEALAIYTRQIGVNHPDIVRVFRAQANVHTSMGHLAEAEKLLRQALDIFRSYHLEQSTNTAVLLSDLGNLLSEKGDDQLALEYHQKALQIYQEKSPQNYPAIATIHCSFGRIYETSRPKEAITHYQKALGIYHETLGEDHPSVAEILIELGNAYRTMQDFDTAISCYSKALSIKTNLLGKDSPLLASAMRALGLAWLRKKEATKALNYLEQAYALYGKLEDNEASLALVKTDLSRCYKTLKNGDKAVKLGVEALEYYRTTYGEEHSYVAIAMNHLGNIHKSLKNNPKALELVQKAQQIYVKSHGNGHPYVAHSIVDIARIKKAMGEYPQALTAFGEALKIAVKVYDPDHPAIQRIQRKIEATKRVAGSLTQARPTVTRQLPPNPTGVPRHLPKPPAGNATQNPFLVKGDRHFIKKEFDAAFESYTLGLRDAEKKNNSIQIGLFLQKMAAALLEKGQYVQAARLVNGGLALHLQTQATEHLDSAWKLMASIERKFLEKVCDGKLSQCPPKFIERRERLKTLRDNCFPIPFKGDCPEKSLLTFTEGIDNLLSELLSDCLTQLGQPPCKFALMGLGDLARKEMGPYSKISFAFIVEKESTKARAYFKNLVILLELKVIGFGETAVPILNHGLDSPTIRGCSFSEEIPFLHDTVEFYGTPEQLGQYQSEQSDEKDLHLAMRREKTALSMRTVRLIAGDAKLFTACEQIAQGILSKKVETLFIRESQAVRTMLRSLLDVNSQFQYNLETTPFYQLREELYHPLHTFISLIADYHGIRQKNTCEALDLLQQKQVLNKVAVGHLKSAFRDVIKLRIRCHRHYKCERETVYHPLIKNKDSEPCAKSGLLFQLDDNDLACIRNIYKVLYPLNQVVQRLCLKQQFAELIKHNFFDDSPLSQGFACENLGLTKDAKACYQPAVKMLTREPALYLAMGGVCSRLGQYEEALQQVDVALGLAESAKDDHLQGIALNAKGIILRDSKKFAEAKWHFVEAMQIESKLYEKKHPYLIIRYYNIAKTQHQLEQVKEALQVNNLALLLSKTLYGPEHLLVAQGTHLMAQFLDGQTTLNFTIVAREEELRVCRSVDEPLAMVQILNELALSYWAWNKNQNKSAACQEEALRIVKKIFGEEHPRVAGQYNYIGHLNRSYGQKQQAILAYQEAVRIQSLFNSGEDELLKNYQDSLQSAKVLN